MRNHACKLCTYDYIGAYFFPKKEVAKNFDHLAKLKLMSNFLISTPAANKITTIMQIEYTQAYHCIMEMLKKGLTNA